MRPAFTRRYRRRSTSSKSDGAFFKKEGQHSFGESAQDSFFQPAVVGAGSQAIQRKCKECEGDDKKVQRAEDKKEEEKIQRQPEKKEEEKVMKMEDKKEEEKVQRQPEKKEEEKVQKKESGGSSSTHANSTGNYISSIKGRGGQPLPSQTNAFFSSRMGHDFSNVKVHTDKEAAESARGVNAKAYAIGNNIVFNEGQYDTESGEGKKLMAHELAHVAQNNAGSELLRQPDPSNDRSDDRQISLAWNFNEIFGDAIESIKTDTGAKLGDEGEYKKLAKRLNEIRFDLAGRENPPVIGQPVIFTLHIPNIRKCKWKDFFKCDYTITASYIEPPPLTVYEKVVKELAYCTQCAVKLWVENGTVKADVTRLSVTDKFPYPFTQEDNLKLTKSLREIKQSKEDGEDFLFFDRTVQQPAAAPEPAQADQPESCDDLEEGLKEACEINQAHKLAAVQSAEGLKSATCYGSKLDLGLCALPMVGGLKQIKNATEYAGKLQDVNKLAKLTKLSPEVITDLRNIAAKLSAVTSKRDKTVAVGAVQIDGQVFYVYTVSRNWTNKKLRQVADKLNITRWQADLAQSGGGAHHAEQIMIEAAEVNDMKLLAISPSRPFCTDCVLATGSTHIHMINP